MIIFLLSPEPLPRTLTNADSTESIKWQVDNILWKVPTSDKLELMKLPARLLLAALTLGVGALSPVVPVEASLPKSQTSGCCASQEMGRCNSCPMTMGDAPSGLASSCCSIQPTCCTLYFARATPFSTSMRVLGTIGVSDQCATARAERPPVPPPRVEFS
jgi:hypothetical protein